MILYYHETTEIGATVESRVDILIGGRPNEGQSKVMSIDVFFDHKDLNAKRAKNG